VSSDAAACYTSLQQSHSVCEDVILKLSWITLHFFKVNLEY